MSRRAFGRLAAGLGIVGAGGAACGRPQSGSRSTPATPPPGPSGPGIGYVLGHEQFTTARLLDQAQAAEHAGFRYVWASDHLQPFQPFQSEVAAEETGRAGEQHCAHFGAQARQGGRGGQRRGVLELVQRQVTCVHLGDAATVHRREHRPFSAWATLRFDVVGEGLQVVGRADDDQA